MTGQNVKPTMKAAPVRTIKKATTRSPAAEASCCTSRSSSSSMLGQSENKQGHDQHEDTCDKLVIGFVRFVVFHKS